MESRARSPAGGHAYVNKEVTVKPTAENMEFLLVLLAFRLAIGTYSGYGLAQLWWFESLVKE